MSREPQLPSDAEWKVLHALWKRHPATARELLARLESEGWAYNTLKTMLARMVEKGFVRAELRGQTTSFEPLLEQQTAQRNALRRVLERVFEGAAGPLLAHLAEEQKLSAAERRKLEGWLAERERKEKPRGQR